MPSVRSLPQAHRGVLHHCALERKAQEQGRGDAGKAQDGPLLLPCFGLEAERGQLRAEKGAGTEDQRVFQENQPAGFFIVQEGKWYPEEEIIRQSVAQEESEPDPGQHGAQQGKRDLGSGAQLPSSDHQRQMQAQVLPHQQEGPMAHGKVRRTDQVHPARPIQEGTA